METMNTTPTDGLEPIAGFAGTMEMVGLQPDCGHFPETRLKLNS